MRWPPRDRRPRPVAGAVSRSTTSCAAGSPPPSTGSRALGATIVRVDLSPGPRARRDALRQRHRRRARRGGRRRRRQGRRTGSTRPWPRSSPTPAAWTAVDAYRAEYRSPSCAPRFAAAVGRTSTCWPLPTTPILPTLAAVARRPVRRQPDRRHADTFVNLADAACVVVPCEPGVPAGLQLVAPAWHDDALADLAAEFEREAS